MTTLALDNENVYNSRIHWLYCSVSFCIRNIHFVCLICRSQIRHIIVKIPIYYYQYHLLLPTRSITCNVQKHLKFIYKPLTINVVHCKYIVSDKPTPPIMCQVLTMGTNEYIAMGSTHKCREGYQELLLIDLK